MSPMFSVRQYPIPVSPGCSVRGTLSQSVTVNGSAGIFMSLSFRRCRNLRFLPGSSKGSALRTNPLWRYASTKTGTGAPSPSVARNLTFTF